MTVNKLYKILKKLIQEGHGRKTACVDKSSFQHNCEEDGCCVLSLEGVNVKWIPEIDDDGGVAENKDGSEKGRMTCVLTGNCEESTQI